MAVGPFLTHDTGYNSVLTDDNWLTDDHYAVLATNSESPDRETQIDYEDILQECADADYSPVAITGESASIDSTKTQYSCSKIDFGSDVTISARYLYILKGTAASPANADEIIGHIDLTGASENISSNNSEFSFTPNATYGLFEVERSGAPA
jgi:hypothetical protein